ncbi:MFS transporter [Micrococcus flavus]|uniref:Putative proline/betaine transporter n=1 Tax=Micrococcus flavus TaxID=384602 RepID=A0A4Y8X2S3_9MICC|nr:MFS transporter [Micrococcus flavus]MBB4881849.1 MFS family permease [Micrococcus flavus]TFI03602.1 MFS transporter [Micrococcus flavus]GGK45360.1 MFS transporter [Micrococcus flavus]
MSHTVASPATSAARDPREERKVLAGTLVGTTIEWYDFFIYAQAAALILGPLFFAPMGAQGAQIASWASLGISFLVRPLGAIVAGHMGDRFGRKIVLSMTLIGMGAATVLIGLLPTYAQIGVWAPILLVLLRLLQGFSAGGEWGGAALLSVEHAPHGKRGLFGSAPQVGVPLGMLMATGVLFAVRASMSPEAFLEWGWRVPFLLSVVLILVGHIIRKAVEESPVFKEMQQLKKDESAPLGDLFRNHTRTVVLAALIFAANNAVGYLVIAWFAKYGQKNLGMEPTETLTAALVGGAGWFLFTLFGGWISDKIGRRLTFQLGYAFLIIWSIPMFLMMNTASLPLFAAALFVLTLGLGPSYGPQSAMYAEMFPAKVRFSGVSIGYAIGAIIGGAFAPLIADLLLPNGWTWVAGYMIVISLISLVAVSMVPKGIQDRNLHDHEHDELGVDVIADAKAHH